MCIVCLHIIYMEKGEEDVVFDNLHCTAYQVSRQNVCTCATWRTPEGFRGCSRLHSHCPPGRAHLRNRYLEYLLQRHT